MLSSLPWCVDLILVAVERSDVGPVLAKIVVAVCNCLRRQQRRGSFDAEHSTSDASVGILTNAFMMCERDASTLMFRASCALCDSAWLLRVGPAEYSEEYMSVLAKEIQELSTGVLDAKVADCVGRYLMVARMPLASRLRAMHVVCPSLCAICICRSLFVATVHTVATGVGGCK
jgi:hypothetical protein